MGRFNGTKSSKIYKIPLIWMKIKGILHSLSPKMAIFPPKFQIFQFYVLTPLLKSPNNVPWNSCDNTELKKSKNIEEGVSCKYKIMVTFATCKFWHPNSVTHKKRTKIVVVKSFWQYREIHVMQYQMQWRGLKKFGFVFMSAIVNECFFFGGPCISLRNRDKVFPYKKCNM